MCLIGMFTSVPVLKFVFITFRVSFQQCASEIVNYFYGLIEQYCHIIQVSNHVQVDRSKSGCNDVRINLYITHVMTVSNPGNGNKTLEQNDSCIVMSFILWQRLLFLQSRIA